jgi:hypothetical protein
MHALRCKACHYEACHCLRGPSAELDQSFQLQIAATFGDTDILRSVLDERKFHPIFLLDAFEAAVVAGEVDAVHLLADLCPLGTNLKFWKPATPPVIAWVPEDRGDPADGVASV